MTATAAAQNASKKEAAQALARWFKTYKTPDDQFDGEGFLNLNLCAIACIAAFKPDDEGATDEEVAAFVTGIRDLLIQSAILSLLRDGEISATVTDGELAFSHLS